MRGRPSRAAERLFRTLLRLYPSTFRAEAHQELLAVFRDLWTEEARGPLSRVRLASTLVRDALLAATAEWIRPIAEMLSGRSTIGRWGMMETIWRDLRIAARGLRRAPSFTAIAVGVLALGIGANATLFTLMSRVFLDPPIHVADADRLVRITQTIPEREIVGAELSYPDYVYYRDNANLFDGMAAYDRGGIALTLATGSDLQTPARGWFVSGNYFEVLKTEPALGRWFRPEEDRTAATRAVAVLSHGLWQSAFSGDREVLGRRLSLNGHPFTVIGVAPQRFAGVSPIETPPDVWVPLNTLPILRPDACECRLARSENGARESWLTVIGRRGAGVSFEAAEAQMRARATSLSEKFADEWYAGHGIALWDHYRYGPAALGRIRTMTRLLGAVAAMVLIIATANVAMLLLARGSARRRDMAIRVSVGAGKGSVVRAFLAESLLISFGAGVVGIAIAFWVSDAAAGFLPGSFNLDFTPDMRVLTVTFVVSTLAAVSAGIIPAFRTAGVDVNTTLKSDGDTLPRNRANGLLVTLQLALSMMLVVGAGIFVRSLINVRGVDLGFETEGRLYVGVAPMNQGYEAAQRKVFMREALGRISALPGVGSAATTIMVPLSGRWSIGAEDPVRGGRLSIEANAVSPGYLEVMGLSLRAGRELSWSDNAEEGGSVMVNETLAAKLWPDQNPVGQKLNDDGTWTVVGVVSNATYYEIGEEPTSQIYFPHLSRRNESMFFVVAATPGSGLTARAVGDVIHELDGTMPITFARSIEDIIRSELDSFQATATMATVFATLALLLAGAGLYGVLSYLVVRRTREIGIRLALGAEKRQVARSVVLRGVRLAVMGSLVGLIASLAATRLVESFLFDVGARDPVIFAVVPLILIGVAALAGVIPAMRAARLDPLTAIRAE